MILLLSILQTILAHIANSQLAKISPVAAHFVSIFKFLGIAVLTIKDLGRLGNNPSSLFNIEKCAAVEPTATRAAEMAFFVVFYGS